MVKDIRPLVENFHTEDWFNAVRNVAGPEFAQRIPEATQVNIKANVEQMWNDTRLRNQFIDALVNRIGLTIYKNLSWTNPLAKFKRGMLTNGETIQEIMAGLLEAKSYDANRDELEHEIFGRMTPEVQVSYHHIDRQDRYKLTIPYNDLRQAFLTPNGLSEFVTNLMSSLQNSDQWDEYLIMSRLFAMFDEADAFFNVNVPDLSDFSVDSSLEARHMLKELKRFGNTLPFVSRVYNPAGLPVAARRDEMELFVTASADSSMDVDALAAAFNIGRAEFASRKTVLPDGAFGIDGAQAILSTRDLFVCADNLIETTSIFNPATLHNNYWMHHWGVYSMSRFVPVVMFNSIRPSTVISETATTVTGMETITVNDLVDGEWTSVSSVERGHSYSVFANATTSPEGGPNDAVLYNVTGTQELSQFTYITNNGDLKVGPDERNATLTVHTVSLYNSEQSATKDVTVTGDLIIPWPNPEVIPDSDNDGLNEVTPVEPEFADNVITIPSVTGVQYKDGATNLNNGVQVTVTDTKTITAVARSGFELTSGATASWTFTAV